jgi:hypothetical protein
MQLSPWVCAASLFILLSSPLRAQEPATAARSHIVSITVSAVPALDGIAQIHAELAGSGTLGIAAIVGGGSVEGYQSEPIDYRTGPFPIILLGAQASYYPFGDFENGMQIGGQALLKLTHRDAAHYNYYRGGAGIEMVPYIGYKLIAGPGITFNAQAGVGTMLNRDFITTSYTEISPAGKRVGHYEYIFHTQALLHLNIGWSF